MNTGSCRCIICSANAEWVCVRPPSNNYLIYLCGAHWSAFQKSHPDLAVRYDRLIEGNSAPPAQSARISA